MAIVSPIDKNGGCIYVCFVIIERDWLKLSCELRNNRIPQVNKINDFGAMIAF